MRAGQSVLSKLNGLRLQYLCELSHIGFHTWGFQAGSPSCPVAVVSTIWHFPIAKQQGRRPARHELLVIGPGTSLASGVLATSKQCLQGWEHEC